MKKLTKKQLQAIETKKKIFNATFELMNDYTYEEIKIMMIVEKAGVSAGSFYVYYNSKEDVVLDAADLFIQPFEELIEQLDESKPYEKQIIFLCKERNELIKKIGGKLYMKTAMGKQVMMRQPPKTSATEIISNKILEILEKAKKEKYFNNKKSAIEILFDINLIYIGITFGYCTTDNNEFKGYYLIEDYLKSLKVKV